MPTRRARQSAWNPAIASDKLVLSLNKVASERSMKGYTVDIPYVALKGILRADGPLGSWQR